MSWPPGITPVTITGKYFDAARQPLTGTVTFELTIPLTDVPDQQFLRGAPVTGTIGAVTPGIMSVQVACNDSPGLTPAGSLYKVTERVDGTVASVSYYSLSRALGAEADLSLLTPVAPPTGGAPLLQQYLVEPTGTPQAGDVPAVIQGGSSQTAWAQPGGGVTEVNGMVGSVVITAAGINADPAGAASTAQSNAEAAASAAIGALTAASVGADPAGAAAGVTVSSIGAASAAALAAEASRAEAAEAGAAQKTANLSDLPDASAARSNLGLDSAATEPSSAFDPAGAAAAAQAAAEAASVPAGTVMPGQLLASSSYAPTGASPTTVSCTTTTLTAFSSANISTGSFTAPASGSVLVTVSAVISQASSNQPWALGLAAHGTTTPLSNLVIGQFQSGTLFVPATFQFLVTGLAPGGTYNLDLVGAIAAGGTGIQLHAWGQSSATPVLTSNSTGSPVTMSVLAA